MSEVTYDDKVKALEANHKKQLDKYYKAMSHQMLSVEVDALYNVLVLNKESEYTLTKQVEANVRRILNLKPQ